VVAQSELVDSVAAGRAARKATPRSSHADFDPGSDRPDPIELLERQAQTRAPELVPIRHGRMAGSPFAFYRGATAIMARDLATTARTGLQVQCCGDAHLSNFGVFGSPERQLVFDLNDFDETLPGPWEWDVKRLAASLVIAARENGYPRKAQERIARDAVAGYRTTMREFAERPNLEVWYAQLRIEAVLDQLAPTLKPGIVRRARRALDKSRTRDSMSAFSKLTHIVDGEPRIAADPPIIVPIDELVSGRERDELRAFLRNRLQTYRDSLPVERRALLDQYRLVDLAHKVVGVGSVGTRAWIALMMGRYGRDPLFLQLKEAQASVLEDHLGQSAFDNHGQRVVVGQRLMQATSDIFLGWLGADPDDGQGGHLYCRQLRDWKGSADIDDMPLEGMRAYGRLCSWTLARAHARSGDRVAIAAYLGAGTRFDEAVAAFAQAYADQNERDHAALVDAIASGRLEAQTGV
jgi:uncharacterized protein (DUF2252 family)